jgi:hypothetical protein
VGLDRRADGLEVERVGVVDGDCALRIADRDRPVAPGPVRGPSSPSSTSLARPMSMVQVAGPVIVGRIAPARV